MKAVSKIIFAVGPVRILVPFTSSHIPGTRTSATSYGVTSQGYFRQKFGKDLPLPHCP